MPQISIDEDTLKALIHTGYRDQALLKECLEAMESVVASYVLYTGSAQETPDMKRARTLMGEAMDKVRAELP
jgi:hypothetical protein